jgi:hypothetical protein
MGMTRVGIIGVVIWAAATAALRFRGEWLFESVETSRALLLLGVSLPLMIGVAVAVLGRFHGAEKSRAAIVLVAPGMLLDTISAVAFPNVFPNIRADAAGLFGGWLLFCNVVVLLTAVLWSRRSLC